jgi:hypothetical protein
LLELGRDFAFVGEQYLLPVGGQDFRLDLLFYHRELQSLVAIELKVDEFKPEYLGKLEFYLEALDRDVRKPHENPSIGVLLCASKDNEVVASDPIAAATDRIITGGSPSAGWHLEWSPWFPWGRCDSRREPGANRQASASRYLIVCGMPLRA